MTNPRLNLELSQNVSFLNCGKGVQPIYGTVHPEPAS